MSSMMAKVVRAVRTRLESGPRDAYASMRVAGATTPCYVFDVSIDREVRMDQLGSADLMYSASVTVECIADTLDLAMTLADELLDIFEGGPHSVTIAGDTITLVLTAFSCQTRAEMPDDGQQDGERIASCTISLQVKES